MSAEKPAKERRRSDILRERFSKNGLKDFSQNEIVELLLSYSAPAKINTEELAQELIDKYGTVSEVFEADYYALTGKYKLNENTASLFRLITSLAKYSQTHKNPVPGKITKVSEMESYLFPYFFLEKNEIFISVFLDETGRLLKTDRVTQDNTKEVFVDIKSILNSSFNVGAKYLIIAHNHPGGEAVPSNEDIELTKKFSKICSGFSLSLCEHFIFGAESTFRLSRHSRLKKSVFTPFLTE